MKKLLFFVIILLVGCQANTDHIGCQQLEISKGTCELADSDSNNANIFVNIDITKIQTESIIYYKTTSGFIAQPSKPGKYPGIIMIHEWWGLNNNIKDMAKLLAQEGFVVLAVDLYNGEVASSSDQAKKLATLARSNPDEAIENMQAASSFLKSLPNVIQGKIASMGWCFGGGQSLQLALSGENFAATVIYYGTLTIDVEKLKMITWPILGIFGEKDTSIPISSVQDFKSAINSLGIENEIHIYPGVGHAFANPSGSRFAPKETVDAWDKTVKFLKQNLS